LIYVIRNDRDGFLKIGFSDDPMKRLKQLQTATPYKMELVAVFEGERDLEAAIHRHLRHHRLSGEWFAWSWTVTELVRRLQGCPLAVDEIEAGILDGGLIAASEFYAGVPDELIPAF
jgi:hypothetical protein